MGAQDKSSSWLFFLPKPFAKDLMTVNKKSLLRLQRLQLACRGFPGSIEVRQLLRPGPGVSLYPFSHECPALLMSVQGGTASPMPGMGSAMAEQSRQPRPHHSHHGGWGLFGWESPAQDSRGFAHSETPPLLQPTSRTQNPTRPLAHRVPTPWPDRAAPSPPGSELSRVSDRLVAPGEDVPIGQHTHTAPSRCPPSTSSPARN